MSKPETIKIDEVEYVRKDSLPCQPTGSRAVVVVDRGWIFAGDVTEQDGRIYLDRAIWVFRWESIGFDGVLANPKNSKVTLKPLKNRVDIPAVMFTLTATAFLIAFVSLAIWNAQRKCKP